MNTIKTLAVVAVLGWLPQAHAEEWAPALLNGATLPAIEAPDTLGQIQTNETLMGENGLLMQFNRSSDW
jgi:hypothetical protein